jgi:hypothetical protein
MNGKVTGYRQALILKFTDYRYPFFNHEFGTCTVHSFRIFNKNKKSATRQTEDELLGFTKFSKSSTWDKDTLCYR